MGGIMGPLRRFAPAAVGASQKVCQVTLQSFRYYFAAHRVKFNGQAEFEPDVVY